MEKFFTTSFFKFLLGFSLIILASFAVLILFSGEAKEKTVAPGAAIWYDSAVHDWRQQAEIV